MNKVPRGPLSYEQIRALMKEGLIRHNDIAFLVPDKSLPGDEKQPSEWKLLWQFPEFDRRLEADEKKEKPAKPEYSGASTPEAMKLAEPERRREMPPEEAKEKTRESLPPEMLDIAPEDLVVHSTTHQESANFSAAPEERPKISLPEFNLPSSRVVWAMGGILILLVTVGVMRMRGGKTSGPEAPRQFAGQEMNRIDRAPGAVKRNLPSARTPSQPASRLSGGGAGPRPVSPRAPEPRIPASSSSRDDDGDRDRGEIDRRDDEDDGDYDEDKPKRPANKVHPTPNRRKSRILSDEEEGGDRPDDDAPPPYSDDD